MGKEEMRSLKQAIIGRMRSENAADLSNTEIERTLSGCVAKTMLINTAKWLRDSGELMQSDIAN